LLIDSDNSAAQRRLNYIYELGKEYGLSLNWKKVVGVAVNSNWVLYNDKGGPIAMK
jgi:hypothetical protein